MTKAEAKMVREFKHSYPELCRGKTDAAILLHARFVEAVRSEIIKEWNRFKATGKPDIAWRHDSGAEGESTASKHV